MLSYRHAFHAGNHADALKHFCLFEAIEYFKLKDKPFWYVDTHSGAGMYLLSDPRAARLAESQSGWLALKDSPLKDGRLERFSQAQANVAGPGRYAGSWVLAASLMRGGDKLRLFEAHPKEFELLRRNVGKYAPGKMALAEKGDGFEGLAKVLPPPPRRAVALIDPSYEVVSDYLRAPKALRAALGKFSGLCAMIWYPILKGRSESEAMSVKLRAACAEFGVPFDEVRLRCVDPDKVERGMTGSGMFIVNPPYGLIEAERESMPLLAEILSDFGAKGLSVERSADAPKSPAAPLRAAHPAPSASFPSRGARRVRLGKPAAAGKAAGSRPDAAGGRKSNRSGSSGSKLNGSKTNGWGSGDLGSNGGELGASRSVGASKKAGPIGVSKRAPAAAPLNRVQMPPYPRPRHASKISARPPKGIDKNAKNE